MMFTALLLPAGPAGLHDVHCTATACYCLQALRDNCTLHSWPTGLEVALASRLDEDVAASLLTLVYTPDIFPTTTRITEGDGVSDRDSVGDLAASPYIGQGGGAANKAGGREHGLGGSVVAVVARSFTDGGGGMVVEVEGRQVVEGGSVREGRMFPRPPHSPLGPLARTHSLYEGGPQQQQHTTSCSDSAGVSEEVGVAVLQATESGQLVQHPQRPPFMARGTQGSSSMTGISSLDTAKVCGGGHLLMN